MKILLVILFAFSCQLALAKTSDQQKKELKEIYESGGITKIEYEKAIEIIDKPEQKEKLNTKKFFSLKKDKKNKLNFFKKKDEDLEEITLKKIEELGKPKKLDNRIYPAKMDIKFKGCNNSFTCRGKKAASILFKSFSRSKRYSQQNPGELIQAMAMYEVFYAEKLYKSRNNIERYKKKIKLKEDNETDKKNTNAVSQIMKVLKVNQKKDENEIRSLIGINKGRKSMREALGMNLDTSVEMAIKRFWLLGEFLELGTGINNEKLDKDLKERQELLETYKLQISSLRKKLQDDLEKEESENSVE